VLTKTKSADKKLFLQNLLKKRETFGDGKNLKYLLKGQMINAMNVSLKSITNALDVNVCGR
jgi:hypothetical protein